MSDELATVRVVLLAGEEFQRSERLAEVVAETVDPATRDFNYDVVRPDDPGSNKRAETIGRVAELIMTFPMMAARRVIVLRDFDSYPTDMRKKLAAVIADTPDTALVVVEGEKATLSPKPKTGLLSESFKPIYENRLPGWIRERFRKRSVDSDDRAAALLINNVGTELRELDGEIEKVVTSAPDVSRISDTEVSRVVGAFKRDTIYGFTNAVGRGAFVEAAGIMQNLMEREKGKEMFYLSSLQSHFMNIAEYNRRVRAGESPQSAQKTVIASPFLWKLNRMDQQAKRLTPMLSRRSLMAVGRAESLLKKSAMDKRLLVELMLPLLFPDRPASRKP